MADIDLQNYLNQKLGNQNNPSSDIDLNTYLKEKTNPSNISTLESLGRGAINPLGVAPIAYGASQSPLGALKSLQGLLGQDVSSDPDVAKYAQARDESKQAFQAAQKAHPVASFVGSLAPFVAGAVLTGGASATAELPAIGTEAAEFGNLAGNTLNLANLAKTGAALGGAGGALEGNADLTKGQVGQFAKDIGTGTALGAVTAATLGPLTQLGMQGLGAGYNAGKSALSNLLEKTETGSSAIKSYQMGQAGENLANKETRRAIEQEGYNTASELNTQLNNELRKVGSQIGEAVNNSDVTFNPDDIGSQLNTIVDDLYDKGNTGLDKQKIKGVINQYIKSPSQEQSQEQSLIESFSKNKSTLNEIPQQSDITPNDLLHLKQDISKLTSFGDNSLSTKEGNNAAKLLSDKLDDIIDQNVEGFAEPNQRYSDLIEGMKALKLANKEPDINKTTQAGNLINRLENETYAGSKARFITDQALERIGQTNPEIADKLQNTLPEIAKRVEVARKAGGTQFGKGLMSMMNVIPTNIAGQTSRKMSALTSLPKETLLGMASLSRDMGGKLGENLANILSSAAERDDVGKNALLFSVLQNPDYRRLIQGDELKEENK